MFISPIYVYCLFKSGMILWEWLLSLCIYVKEMINKYTFENILRLTKDCKSYNFLVEEYVIQANNCANFDLITKFMVMKSKKFKRKWFKIN